MVWVHFLASSHLLLLSPTHLFIDMHLYTASSEMLGEHLGPVTSNSHTCLRSCGHQIGSAGKLLEHDLSFHALPCSVDWAAGFHGYFFVY